MSLLEALQQQLDSNAIRQMSRQVGADQDSVQRAVSGALPLLITALSRQSAAPGGASALASALDRDHDGSILDDVAGFFGSSGTQPGEAILKHILGGDQRAGTQAALGRASGLDAGQIGQILAMLAPLVMGALGQAKRQKGLDPTDLSGMLNREQRRAEEADPGVMGMLGKMLDANGDGQLGDDVARLGMGMLGKMFGGSGR